MVVLPFVLAWAAYAYLHGGYRTFDLAAQTFPLNPGHGTAADLPADVRRLDGRRVVVDGYGPRRDRDNNPYHVRVAGV